MALTDYTIDETSVGQMLMPEDGFIVALRMVTPPPRYEVPEWDEGRLRWKTAYLCLRGSHGLRDTVCLAPAQKRPMG